MKRWHILLSLLLAGFLFWIIQGTIVHTLFSPNMPASTIITGSDSGELFIRGFTLGLFLSFGLAAMIIIRRLSRAERNACRLNRFLRAVRDVDQIITRETDPHLLITNACTLSHRHSRIHHRMDRAVRRERRGAGPCRHNRPRFH